MSTDLYHSDTEHFSALPHSSTNEHKRNALPAELGLWAAASCGMTAMANALNSRVTLEAIASSICKKRGVAALPNNNECYDSVEEFDKLMT